jgi:hypothetical protein
MELLSTLEMDLTQGWVVRDNPPPNEVTGPLYPCDDPMARAKRERERFDGDPIVYLIRQSAMDQVLTFATP